MNVIFQNFLVYLVLFKYDNMNKFLFENKNIAASIKRNTCSSFIMKPESEMFKKLTNTEI